MSKRTRRQRLQKQRSSERNRGVETVRRLLRAEPLEDRVLLAADLGMDLNHWHNYVRATDVNQDGVTSPVDALVVINELNMGGPRNLALIDSGSPEGETAGRHFLDTNGDNHLTAADALGVIDALNGEGEHSPQVEFRISLTDTNDQPLPQNAGQSQVLLGDNYRMHVETKSINIPPSGVFAAYLDVDFNDAALFDVVVGETQRLTFSPVAISSGSNFTLTFQGEETAPIDITVVSTSNGLVLWPQIAGSIQAALEALPNIDAGDVVVEHAPIENLSDPSNDNPSIFTIRWQGQYVATDVPELSVNVSNVTAGDGSTVTGTIDELYPADSSNVGAFRSAIIVAVNAYQPPGSPFPTAITYNNAVTGAFVGNSFDDLGGFRGDSTFLDDSWFNVLSLDMVATSAGLATYQGTGAVRPGETGYPDGTGNAVLLMGSNDAVSVEEVLYGNSVSVNIVKPVDAQDDTLTIDEDAGLTSVDVLVNDVLAIEGTLAVESVSVGSAGGTVAIAGDALSINYTAANDFNGTETFTYVLTNGAGTTDTGTVTITVNAVNDAPANVVEDALSVNEDATLTFNAANSNQLSVSDIDADPAGVQTVVSVNNGTLVLTTGGGASVTDNGSAAVTISGTTAQVNAALDGMTYTPQTDFNGSDTLTMVTSDLGNTGTGGTLVDTDTVAISVAALNDPPENTVPGNQVLLNMPGAVDNLNLTGATAISVADVDADPAGVQVTLSLDNAGTLTVVSPGNATVGNNGTGGVTVSGTTAEVNGALGDVRYSVDDDNFWDETVVLTVATSDLGNTGSGGTLVDTDTVSIYVAPPSQPYAIDDVGNTTEDPGAALAVDVLANDLLGPNDATLAITEINGASVGVGATATTASGGTVTNNGTSLEYTPAADFNGDDAFTYTIASSPDAGDGPSTGNVTISVAAVNDAPVNVVPGSQLLNNLPGVTDELVFSSANGNPITVSDVDAATVEVTLSLDNTGSLTLPTTNGLQVSGNGSSTIVATGSPADINTALNGLKYAVADDNFYPETVTLTVATSDLGNTGSGGTLGDTDTVQITVDPPSRPYAVDDTGSTTEDPSGPLVLSDVLTNDFVPVGSTAAITEINGASVGVGATATTASGGTVTNNGTSLEYTPAADFNGDDTFSYTIASAPDAGDGPSTANVTVSVTAVNDVPSFTAGSNVTSLEDAGAVVEAGWASGLSAGPADELSQTLSFQVVGNDNPGLFAAPPVVDAVSGDLSFTASPDANGSAVITLLLQDDGGTENGGVDTSASQQFTITIGAVNDTPSFTGGADVTVLEDAGAQTTAAWATNLSKGPSDESGQALSFQVTGNSNSALFASGPAISETGVLSFTPAADANGSATVDIVLTDDGGTADGGNDTSTVYSFDINVTAVNDSPGFTVGGDQTVDEDAGAQAVNGWATAISAGPADESSQVLSFAVTGNTNPSLFASGPSVDASGNLSYETAADANGSATVTLSLSDDGGTANAGVDTSVSQQFTITANAVNDAPSISLPTNPVLITDYDNVFSTANGNALQMSDVDAASGDVVFQFSVGRATGLDVGTLTVSDTSALTSHTGNGTSSVELVGSVAAVNAALGSGVNYQTEDATPTGTTNDFVLTVDVSDQGHSGSGGALQSNATMTGQVFDFIPSTIGGTVYIDADNDGQHTPDSVSLGGVQMVLTGTDFQNATVNETVVTNANGYYEFNNLKPTQSGTSYTVTQVQPDNLIDGQESLEAPLVAAGNDTATVEIGIQGGVDSVSNNFGERGLEPWCISVLDLLASSQDQPGILHSSSTGSVWTALLGSAWDGYTDLTYAANTDGLSAQVAAKYNGQDVSSTVTWNSQARMSMRQDNSGGYVIRVYGTPADLGLAVAENTSGGEGESSRDQFERDVDAVLADGSWA